MPITLPHCARGPVLTREQWKAHVDSLGRVVRGAELRASIFHGGVDPAIRKDVWKYLLHHRRCRKLVRLAG